MDILFVKILVLLIMLVTTFLMGMLPRIVRKFLLRLKHSDTIISSCLCFGAGVLMSIVFLHLFVEVEENVALCMAKGYIVDTSYPIASMIICAGFFLIYLLEEIVHLWVHHHTQDHGEPIELERKLSISSKVMSRERCESHSTVAVLVGCESFCNPCYTPESQRAGSLRNNSLALQVPSIFGTHAKDDVSIDSHDSESKKIIPDSCDTIDSNSSIEVSTLRSILVIVALSLHGTFEGLAVGLEEEQNDIWLMFVALTMHKIFIGFSIGMELLEVGIKHVMYIIYMIIFSMASPLGGVVGIIILETIGQESPEGQLTVTILQGLSGGTILYVTFCEVLERERSKIKGRFFKFLALISGFSLMAVLELIGGHDHAHVSLNQSKLNLINILH